MLFDRAKFKVIAGKGGDGIVSFRREKYVPKGGPDGGNGGAGGSIYIKACRKDADLIKFQSKKIFKAEDGRAGEKHLRTGRSGRDLYLSVPVGTTIYRLIGSKKVFWADLRKPGQKRLIVSGGRGGRGNATFKSSTNQTPQESTAGQKGEEKKIFLRLRLLTDLGIIGRPNAGKSTLLSVISRAKPKIADYPFTTLYPNLGVIEHKNVRLIGADIPGLIEDAHQGRGLGDKFLAHIERCKILIHLIDINQKDLYKNYRLIRKELGRYNKKLLEKPELIVLNKIDLLTDKEIKIRKTDLEKRLCREVWTISAAAQMHLRQLLDSVIENC